MSFPYDGHIPNYPLAEAPRPQAPTLPVLWGAQPPTPTPIHYQPLTICLIVQPYNASKSLTVPRPACCVQIVPCPAPQAGVAADTLHSPRPCVYHCYPSTEPTPGRHRVTLLFTCPKPQAAVIVSKVQSYTTPLATPVHPFRPGLVVCARLLLRPCSSPYSSPKPGPSASSPSGTGTTTTTPSL